MLPAFILPHLNALWEHPMQWEDGNWNFAYSSEIDHFHFLIHCICSLPNSNVWASQQNEKIDFCWCPQGFPSWPLLVRVPKVIGLEMTIGHHISRTSVKVALLVWFHLQGYLNLWNICDSLQIFHKFNPWVSVGLGHSSSEVESLIEEENWVGIYETTFWLHSSRLWLEQPCWQISQNLAADKHQIDAA